MTPLYTAEDVRAALLAAQLQADAKTESVTVAECIEWLLEDCPRAQIGAERARLTAQVARGETLLSQATLRLSPRAISTRGITLPDQTASAVIYHGAGHIGTSEAQRAVWLEPKQPQIDESLWLDIFGSFNEIGRD